MQPTINNDHYPMLLTKEYLIDAVSDIDSISIEDSDDNGMFLWDEEDCKHIRIRFPETMSPEHLADTIHISNDIPAAYQIDRQALAEYLWNICDKNAFITLEDLVVIWSEPENPATLEPSDFVDEQQKRLAEQYGDDYAYEIGADYLGQLWFERNIVVINMGNIVRIAVEIAQENSDLTDPYFSVESQIQIGFLTTVIHELRHLQLDTNILLPEELYPISLGAEEAVEEYCREVFEANGYSTDIFPSLSPKYYDLDLTSAAHAVLDEPDIQTCDLSSLSAISETADLARTLVSKAPDPFASEAIWLDGYACALQNVAKQLRPTHDLINDLLDYLADHLDGPNLFEILHRDLSFTEDEIASLGFDLNEYFSPDLKQSVPLKEQIQNASNRAGSVQNNINNDPTKDREPDQ